MGEQEVQHHEHDAGCAPQDNLNSAHGIPDALHPEVSIGQKQQRGDKSRDIASHHHRLTDMHKQMNGEGYEQRRPYLHAVAPLYEDVACGKDNNEKFL